MHRVSKAILAGLAGCVGAGILAGLAVGWYAGTPGARAGMEAALSGRLGGEVRFAGVDFSVFRGFRVEGLEVVRGQDRVLSVPVLRADVRWLPLLKRRLWVEAVELESPVFRCVQGEAGDWALPVLGRKAAGKSGGGAPGSEPAGVRASGGSWRIGRVAMRGGTVELIGKGGGMVGVCTGIQFFGNRTMEGLEGRLEMEELKVVEWGRLEKVESALKLDSDWVCLEGVKAVLAGGTMEGGLRVGISRKGTPFESGLWIRDCDVDEVLSDAGVEGRRMTGRLHGWWVARGEFSKFKQLNGEGELWVENGTLRQLDVLRAVGQVLKVEELERLDLTGAHARFALGRERALVPELELESARVGISGSGTLQFDGKANFEVLLGLQEGLHKRLPDFVRESFHEVDAGNRPAVRFKVAGRSGQLRTDLAEKLVGKKVADQLENLVSTLLGRGRKSEKGEGSSEGKDSEDGKKRRKKAAPDESSAAVPPGVPEKGVRGEMVPGGDVVSGQEGKPGTEKP